MNKKILLAIFLGLVASACALIASLLLLQEVDKQSGIEKTVAEIKQKIDNGDVAGNDVARIEKDIVELFTTMSKLEEKDGSLSSDLINLKKDIKDLSAQTTELREEQKDTMDYLQERLTEEPTTTEPNDDVEEPTTKPNEDDEEPTTTTDDDDEEPTTPTTKPTTPTKKSGSVYGVSDYLNMRNNPGQKETILDRLQPSEKFEIFIGQEIKKDGHTWIKVKNSKGQVGWVAKQYVK